MAHFTLVTAGSRGDIQPYIALGLGLQAHGHTARLATHALYADWIRGYGLEFTPVEGDPMAAFQQEHGRDWVETGRDGREFLRGFQQFIGPLLHQATADTLAACAGTDMVLFSAVGFYVTYSVAEKLGLPFLQAFLQPINPTREFPSVIYPTTRQGGPVYNYATHALGGYQIWLRLRPVLNDIRRQTLGLRPSLCSAPSRTCFARKCPSSTATARRCCPSQRTGARRCLCPASGSWMWPAISRRSALADFLAAGPPPIYIGFGSMTGNDPERLTRVALEAVRLSGQRAVLLAGWAGLATGEVPPDVLRLDSAPHDWLFPRMAAVVHHGGVGTTHEALRAGRPQVVVPFFGDQPFWADRVYSLGVSPPPLHQAEMTAERLAAAIRAAIGDATMQKRAADVGERVCAEQGVAGAVAIVERYLGQRPGFFTGLRE